MLDILKKLDILLSRQAELPPIEEVQPEAVKNEASQPEAVKNSFKKSGVLDMAVHYLQVNPGAMQLSGRELEARVFPDQRIISYRTWNKAKKIVEDNA